MKKIFISVFAALLALPIVLSAVSVTETMNPGNVWTNQQVSVSFDGTCQSDTGSCSKIYYTIDGSEPTTASNYVDATSSQAWTFTLTQEGQYTTKYLAQDSYGAFSPVMTAAAIAKIDKTAPAISVVDNTSNTQTTSDIISVYVTDSLSGVLETRYIISDNGDCGPINDAKYDTGLLGTSVDANNVEIYLNKYICFRTKDNVGNTAYVSSGKIINLILPIQTPGGETGSAPTVTMPNVPTNSDECNATKKCTTGYYCVKEEGYASKCVKTGTTIARPPENMPDTNNIAPPSTPEFTAIGAGIAGLAGIGFLAFRRRKH